MDGTLDRCPIPGAVATLGAPWRTTSDRAGQKTQKPELALAPQRGSIRSVTPAQPNIFSGDYAACLFDMDGVLTDTASVHATSWKTMFDEFLRHRAEATGEPFVEFDTASDYLQYVDGKARASGVRDFLASRGIVLPEGTPDDAPTEETVNGLGNRKNELVLAVLESQGADVYQGSVDLVRAVRAAGMKTGVVSSSANTPAILGVAGITDLFETRVDGNVARELGLPSKPDPTMFLEAARRLGIEPERCIVFEDAISGVAAGKAGGFGLTVGVDRVNQRQELLNNGATFVVDDLSQLLPPEAQ